MTDSTRGALVRAIDWTFRDRTTGRITLAQAPNLPLWLFLILTVLAWIAGWIGGSFAPAVGWLGIGAHLALAWWAVDELLRGVNPWRRFLGASVLLGLVALDLVPRLM